jgi:predicted regulator of Ras-like GTPase activity (Roadblock/LC7/MglB family)
MKDMILFPEDIDRLDGILTPLTQKANLLLATLINKDGRLLTSQGILESVDIVSLAALVAGNTASTQAIATLVGETEFCAMYHQGKNKHIYITNADDDTFLSLIFDDRTNIDRVKVFARQFDKQLKEALVQVYNKSEDQINLDIDMNTMLFGSSQPPQPQPAAYATPPPQQQPGGEVHYMNMGTPAPQQQQQQFQQQQQMQTPGDPAMILQMKIKESQQK